MRGRFIRRRPRSGKRLDQRRPDRGPVQSGRIEQRRRIGQPQMIKISGNGSGLHVCQALVGKGGNSGVAPMIARDIFDSLLGKYTRVQTPADGDMLFGGGLDLSSIGFTEFILELEETTGLDIDIDNLDASIQTVGQLYARLKAA
jgi:acyl carrier protein